MWLPQAIRIRIAEPFHKEQLMSQSTWKCATSSWSTPGNGILGGRTIDSGVVDAVFVGSSLAGEGRNDASGRGRTILGCKLEHDREDEVNVHAAMSARCTETARLQAENQRLRDEGYQVQSAVAQRGSSLGFH
ncbi:uncharacterized protein PHALS_12165 [Plasmopara halstedii]|uniref:Uncharacterized protein n=1 Tax=Plasmopara halstedii TaxID=4781 RepID=A0A0P1ALH2_PLAHL|nr:uncharacterized protein PHALS_12165 [Plasmopara halstedii]CEG41849.1 hypothetical protein PHALS_12165 [Plasmopara halstedii]|eukprot:XP_024578218.1 hypothetical protein PHALS_12165 [Plasmopara halstedii]